MVVFLRYVDSRGNHDTSSQSLFCESRCLGTFFCPCDGICDVCGVSSFSYREGISCCSHNTFEKQRVLARRYVVICPTITGSAHTHRFQPSLVGVVHIGSFDASPDIEILELSLLVAVRTATHLSTSCSTVVKIATVAY